MVEADLQRNTPSPGSGDAAEPTPADQLPSVFGRYLLLRRLSRGGMGEIFLAKLGEIQGFEKLVIIKKVLPNLAADSEFIHRFIDEAQVAIKLNHANIAPVFEVGRVDGEYFLAIGYVEGRDLRRTMARLREHGRRLSPDLALYLVREMAAGLAYAHRRTADDGTSLNLVHCDVSPPNVMLSFEGEVKIIDFGIARSAIRLAQSNPNMGFGKFGYMAPEQLLRGGVIDKRTDLYAAGVVLYELLTGERLVSQPEGGDYRAVARAVTQGKFPPPSSKNPDIEPALDALVMKAMAARPDDRFQTGEALRDAIQTELARVNPTLSSDQMAAVLRELFVDELSEEHELLVRMQAVDLAPFREELTEAGSAHTVTFARAAGAAQLPDASTTAPDPFASVADVEDQISTDAAVASLRPSGTRRVVVYSICAMLAGAGLVAWFARPRRPPAPMPIAVAPPPPVTPVVTPVVTPAGTPVVTPVITPAPPPPKTASIELRHGKHAHHPATITPTLSSTQRAEAVQAKFQRLRGEYQAFKSQYGGVLEERWNAIASEITYGRPGEAKYEQVDQMLDGLRHEMQKVRDGK
jgi:serine/threonine-protein kinase